MPLFSPSPAGRALSAGSGWPPYDPTVLLMSCRCLPPGQAHHSSSPARTEPARVATSWPTRIDGDHLDEDYGAPTSGGPPLEVYEVTPTKAFALPTDGEIATPTRWVWPPTGSPVQQSRLGLSDSLQQHQHDRRRGRSFEVTGQAPLATKLSSVSLSGPYCVELCRSYSSLTAVSMSLPPKPRLGCAG